MIFDLKFTIRSLVKTPGFTIIAVLTLALGIGATCAIFSMVNSVLLQPLPYAQPDSLARIYSEFPTFPNGGVQRYSLTPAEFLQLRRETKSWRSIDAWGDSGGVNVATAGEPTRVTASFITGGVLPSLGVTAKFGRVITPQDDVPGATPVAVISHRLWQRAFAGDVAIVGRDILLNGRKSTVIGVMAKDFRFPPGEVDAPDLWTPLRIDPLHADNNSHSVNVLGRLKSNVSLQQAQAELESLAEYGGRAGSGHRFNPKDHTIVSYPLHHEVVRGVRPALQMLFGAVSLLLLIACVNVANLLLARAEARQREIAIRGALGAGVWSLARQFATEGIVLACSGAAIGLLIAQGGLRFIKAASVAGIPRAADISLDGRVLLFAVAVSLLTGLVFGLVPLAHVLKRNLYGTIKSTAASTTDAVGSRRFRHILIVGQLALALILLTGTGLMLRAFWKLQQVEAGFDPKNVVTMFVGLPDNVYRGEAAREFWARLKGRLEALPGIQSVALTAGLPPVVDTGQGVGTRIEGFVPVQGGPIESVDFYQVITPDYFETLRIQLAAGRFFDERDGVRAPPVAIVNQSMARMFWGSDGAVGRRVRPWFSDEWYTIVGVAADAKNGGLDTPAGTELYLPYAQIQANSRAPAFSERADLFMKSVYVVARSPSDRALIASAVRREVNQLDPALPISRVRTMDEVISAVESRPRFLTLMLTVFASVAMLLAAVGIYGVIAYTVAQRTKEFGLRMALGGQPADVLSLVLRRALLLILCGILIGVGGAFVSTRLLSGILFGVTATDPATFIVVALILGSVAICASYIPALRATKVDPLVALRAE